MKAAQATAYGGKEVIRVVTDAPKPTVGDGMVLVEVHAAGVNPFDWKVREGMVRQLAELHFPATLGGDFAGVVAKVGAGAEGVHVGDEVYGQASALGGQGSFAEFTSVKATSLAPKPQSLDFGTAAGAPLTVVSAYQALVEHAKLQAGQRVLIHGGAGGIGTLAIQLAKHLGAYVATTAAGDDIQYVKDLGADEVIDYQGEDFATKLKDFDVVYDTVGGETYSKSYGVLKRGGVIVSMVEQPNSALAEQYGVTPIMQYTQVTTERLNHTTELFNNGALRLHIDRVFPLDQAAEALEYLHSGKYRGKIVIAVTTV